MSEVLVLGFPDKNNEPVLVTTDKLITNGKKIF